MIKVSSTLAILILNFVFFKSAAFQFTPLSRTLKKPSLHGWVQDDNGEWTWQEDDPAFLQSSNTVTKSIESTAIVDVKSTATPTLPAGTFRPKQSLGQNFLRDGNTVAKIIKYFVMDAQKTIISNDNSDQIRAIELGPGAGALTDTLVVKMKDLNASFQCIEIDPRSKELLGEKHPELKVNLMDVMQADYTKISQEEGGPLSIIGNLPYYITSQILFALADASHFNAIRSATVTMQYEVGERIIAKPCTKDYGILSVVFQLYADCKLHFKIPPTVFYPQPKVDSALIGLHFIGPNKLRERLCGVRPADLRRVLTATFQQRRKTIRNSLKKLLLEVYSGDQDKVNVILDSDPLPLTDYMLRAQNRGEEFALSRELPKDWTRLRPEQLTPGQFVELTRLIFFDPSALPAHNDMPLGKKVWRKMKHGK